MATLVRTTVDSVTLESVRSTPAAPQQHNRTVSDAVARSDSAIWPPVINGVVVGQITATSVQITWNVHPGSTGQIEYGLTPAYGTLSALENSYTYTTHIQTITGLTAGLLYYFRVKSTNPTGQTSYATDGDGTFTTLGSSAIGSLRTDFYGSGVRGDSKTNRWIGSTGNQRVAYRFRARTTSTVVSATWSARTGSGYSGGTGGTMRIEIQTVDAQDLPSGTVLGYLDYTPGAVVLEQKKLTFPVGTRPSVTAGTLYCLVFRNTDGSPTTNYISCNNLLAFDADVPNRQRAFLDEYAVLYGPSAGGWTVSDNEVPMVDIWYGNDQHDGMAYVQAMPTQAYVGLIWGTTHKVRERITVTGGDRIVTGAYVRVGRLAATTEPLHIRLQTGAGALIEEGDVAYTAVPLYDPPWGDEAPGGTSKPVHDNGDWVGLDFVTPRTLTNGQTYHLVLSSPGPGHLSTITQYYSGQVTSQYSAVGIRRTKDNDGDETPLLSWCFLDGVAERTTNGGGAWSLLYAFGDQNLQMYMPI